MESDTDIMSPSANLKGPTQLGLPRNDMCYLSPFSSVSRDRTISESNLSSSGYSSMASPAPSRCNSSSNPLYPDVDEGPSGSNTKFRKMRSNSMQNGKFGDSAYGNCSSGSGSSADQYGGRNKTRSDSETLSDDVLLESNDEGIGTDHIDEKLDGGETANAKELEHFIAKELLDSGKRIMFEEPAMSQLQLPTIIIQTEGNDKASPVSSRSESPIRSANRYFCVFFFILFFTKLIFYLL